MNDELKNAYLEEAERSLSASTSLEKAHIQEKVCFLTYHAFESLGGAYASSRGQTYPPSHVRKLNQFAASVTGRSYRWAVANLTIKLASVRNSMLYPTILANGDVVGSKDRISMSHASNLRKRVAGLFRKMKKDLS